VVVKIDFVVVRIDFNKILLPPINDVINKNNYENKKDN